MPIRRKKAVSLKFEDFSRGQLTDFLEMCHQWNSPPIPALRSETKIPESIM